MPHLRPTCHCTASNTCLCVRALYHRDGSILAEKKWQHMKEAKAMTYSCYQMYARQPTGLSPEFVEFLELTEPVPDERVSGNIGMRACCMFTRDTTTSVWAGFARAYVWPWMEWGRRALASRQELLWVVPPCVAGSVLQPATRGHRVSVLPAPNHWEPRVPRVGLEDLHQHRNVSGTGASSGHVILQRVPIVMTWVCWLMSSDLTGNVWTEESRRV